MTDKPTPQIVRQIILLLEGMPEGSFRGDAWIEYMEALKHLGNLEKELLYRQYLEDVKEEEERVAGR